MYSFSSYVKNMVSLLWKQSPFHPQWHTFTMEYSWWLDTTISHIHLAFNYHKCAQKSKRNEENVEKIPFEDTSHTIGSNWPIKTKTVSSEFIKSLSPLRWLWNGFVCELFYLSAISFVQAKGWQPKLKIISRNVLWACCMWNCICNENTAHILNTSILR